MVPNRARSNGHEPKLNNFHLNIRKNFFSLKGGRALKFHYCDSKSPLSIPRAPQKPKTFLTITGEPLCKEAGEAVLPSTVPAIHRIQDEQQGVGNLGKV